MAWNCHAIEQMQLRRQHRVDGVGRPKFDFHTGLNTRQWARPLRTRLMNSFTLRVRAPAGSAYRSASSRSRSSDMNRSSSGFRSGLSQNDDM